MVLNWWTPKWWLPGFQMKDLKWTHKNAYSGYDTPSEMFQMRSSMSLYSNSIKVNLFWILKPIQHKGENNSHKCKQNLQITVPGWLWQCKSAVRKSVTLFWSSIHLKKIKHPTRYRKVTSSAQKLTQYCAETRNTRCKSTQLEWQQTTRK